MSFETVSSRTPRRGGRHDLRTQFAAVPWRIEAGRVELLLITGRRSGRWGIPRGWAEDGETHAEAAAREAWEEAGASGPVAPQCLGLYARAPKSGRRSRLPCVLALFPLEVRRLDPVWPEAGQRLRRWATTEEAAALVGNRELTGLLLSFDPRALP